MAETKPFLDGLKKSFEEVPIDTDHDDAIATTAFLDASESLCQLFDALGSVAFTPVKNDILGNIKKIRDRQLANPASSEKLQTLCLNELKEKKHTATEGLVWLTRGLDFTAQSLRHNVANPNEELATSFRHAYGHTLKPHHSFMVKPIFSAAMSATPYRKDFYPKLSPDAATRDAKLENWLTALEQRVGILKKFLDRKEAKW